MWLQLEGTGKKKAAAAKTEEAVGTPKTDLSRVCAGLAYRGGEDPVLKDDSDYPDWLWSILDTGKELTPDDKLYWRRLNKQKARDNNLLRKQLGR